MSKIIIFGAGGQLGRELVSIYPHAVPVYHNNRDEITNVDLADLKGVEKILREESPDIVLNAAALANVDLCEKDHRLAYSVNSQAVLSLARTCDRIGATLVHISTDYVFDGTDGNYSEASVPNPINYYGLSKLIGDAYALSRERSIVVRTSGVFGHQRNFPLYVLESLRNNNPINAFQGYYSPIHARNLARAISLLLKTDFSGLINISGDRISRYQLARKIAEAFSLDISLVKEAKELGALNAKRPFDSSLNNALAAGLIGSDFSSTNANIKTMKEVLMERS